MSLERRILLLAYGAKLVLTPGPNGMKGAIAKAEELVRETPNAYMPQQFNNPANPEIHRATTGPEIWSDTDGTADILVSGVGTGGTLTGVSEYIKARKPGFWTVAVNRWTAPCSPAAQPERTRSRGSARVLCLSAEDRSDRRDRPGDQRRSLCHGAAAAQGGRPAGGHLLRRGGACGGKGAREPRHAGKLIVVVLPDFGERYLSTLLFDELRQQALSTPTSSVAL